jgi:transaldolase
MADTTIKQLGEWGQSVWLDNISRSMIDSGKLTEMMDAGLRGITSNPTIFEKAISGSSDYDDAIKALTKAGKSTFEIYDDLTVRDIQDAADMFRPIYEKTNRLDGYVSLEINPELAYDTEATIEEGRRLYKKVSRPNVMFKVPATDPGFDAISTLLGEGANINITLIFSLDQYMKTAQAFLSGMNSLLKKQRDLSQTCSVASVFVGRVDTSVDKMLEEALRGSTADKDEIESLKGKAAVANSHVIYRKYVEIFSGEEFEKLRQHGAQVQRVLWGSTGTKNPAYSDIKYVTELIGKNTVNTLPENTITAFLDHGHVKEALTADAAASQETIDRLSRIGIDIDGICAKLLEEGAGSFTSSFESLLSTLETKAKATSDES